MAHGQLANVEHPNEKGSCWTCVEVGLDCDAALPWCQICVDNSRVCLGYGVRLGWPEFMRNSTYVAASSQPSTQSLSPFGLQPEQNDLLQHYIRHISNIALAVDYSNNGYRRLVPMAVENPALLNSIFALSASHRSKWRGAEDTESKGYLRQSLLGLQKTLRNSEIAERESTLCTMLCLLTYEVFNGSPRWKSHFNAIAGWIRSHRSLSEINPFLKNWVSLIDSQSALNSGCILVSEVEGWLNVPKYQHHEPTMIDPLFGCSAQLPNLMLEAARLYHLSRSLGAADTTVQKEIDIRVTRLQENIQKTACSIQSKPKLVLSCDTSQAISFPTNELGQPDYAQRIIATAEIFRHALHVYIGRIVTGPSSPPDQRMQASIDAVFELLPYVPDASGPGSNLGWALVVIGSEIDAPDLREYIRCRWRGLKLLGMDNAVSAERVLDGVWQRRDAAHSSNYWYENLHWQDVMKACGGDQILV